MSDQPCKGWSNTQVFLAIGAVLVVVMLVLVFVLGRARTKPQSPQAMVAAALTDLFSSPISPNGLEWQPGMGQQPLIYHPAAVERPVWRPLPDASPAAPTPAPVQPQAAAWGGQGGWTALPGAAGAGVAGNPAGGAPPIRAYKGPMQ